MRVGVARARERCSPAETRAMPASEHKAVQTDTHDGRKFITFKVASNGVARYRKVYLQTKNGLTARRRGRAIEELEDVDEARAIIAYLAGSRSPEEEKRRLAEVTGNQPVIPAMTFEEARVELESVVCDFGDYGKGDIPDEIIEDWRLSDTAEQQRQMLVELGVPEDFLNENPGIFTDFKRRMNKVNPDFRPKKKAWEAFFRRPADFLSPDRPARGPRLSACIAEFEIEQDQVGNDAKHRKAYVKHFQAFVTFANDKHIRALTKQDFVKFVDHVISKTRDRSNKTIRDHLSPIRAVIECARVRMDDDVFPEGIDNWLRIIDREKRRRPYKPPRQNREPIPVDVFQTLLGKADEWAELDWEAYAESLPVAEARDRRRTMLAINRNKQHARYIKRVGLATHSMLCLAANVGAQPIDFTRLLWAELILDGDLPLYQEARSKPSHLLGSEVPRCCPLLPETVRSLKRWREWQAAELAKVAARAAGDDGAPEKGDEPQTASHVFTYADGRPMNQKSSDQVSAYLGTLRKAIGVADWQIRHCRNIGSTIRRNAGLPSDMANAWLGHSARETNKLYTGEAGEDYLLPLVREIGRVYFTGVGAGGFYSATRRAVRRRRIAGMG